MAISGVGNGIDVSFIPGSDMLTTTTQFLVVGMAPTSTVANRTVFLAGSGGVGATMCADGAIGINQSYLSSGSQICTVRLLGISKAVCAESIAAGSFVMAYWGVSTTTMAGRIVQVDNGVTITAYGASVSAQTVILGRALENGSTNSVISVFVNPQLYDRSLVGSISIT